MLFNSYIFVCVFLPLILVIWWHPALTVRRRLGFLTLASYSFYGWWDYRFVSLLILSTILDFHVARRLHATSDRPTRVRWLSVSMVTNLGLLAFFKYSGFFAVSVNAVGDWLRMGGTIPVPEIVLPVGISFYTFQTMSYSIDIFRRKAEPTESIWHFAAYVSLFPQLIAGPIVRYGEIDDQLRNIETTINWERFAQGIIFFVVGMIQKVLLADTIAGKINPMFHDYDQLQFFAAWFAMLGYACQLYFDFAGYSNMAVGLGRMLGFEFPQNFASPYKSANIAEFWRRWHMTLSFWLRDYLFVPLGGSQKGRLLTLRNLVIVMFLGGLWHGAGWTFVIWGLYHGGLLVGHSVLRSTGQFTAPRVIRIVITFLLVVIGWTIFRSTDMAMCVDLLASMLGIHGCEVHLIEAVGGWSSAVILATLLAIVFFSPNIWQVKLKANPSYAVALSLAFVICVLRFDGESPFLYFQF